MDVVGLIGMVVGLAIVYYAAKKVAPAQESKGWEAKYDQWRKQSASYWQSGKADADSKKILQKLARQRTVAHVMLIVADIFLLSIVLIVFLALLAGQSTAFDIGLLVLVATVSQWLLYRVYSGITRQAKVFAKIAKEREGAKSS